MPYPAEKVRSALEERRGRPKVVRSAKRVNECTILSLLTAALPAIKEEKKQDTKYRSACWTAFRQLHAARAVFESIGAESGERRAAKRLEQHARRFTTVRLVWARLRVGPVYRCCTGWG